MNYHGRKSPWSLLIGQTITLLYLIVVVPALIITLHAQICNAALPETPTTKCNSSSYYKAGSKFESNLNRVFDSLLQGTKQSGFNISVYGESPDKVYGRLQCREDLTVDQCYTCSQYAMTTIQQYCGNAVGGSIWPFHCFLRYENYNFTGQLDRDIGSICPKDFGVGTCVFIPTKFQRAAENLLNKLSVEAAPETKRSALGRAVESSQTIYGLVQCTRDISNDDCKACLTYAINTIFTSYSGFAGVQYWSQSCIVRYEIYLFFNTTTLSLNPPPNGPMIPSPNQITPCKHSNKTPIILGVAGGSAFVLIVCAFATGRSLKSVIVRRGYEGIAATLFY